MDDVQTFPIVEDTPEERVLFPQEPLMVVPKNIDEIASQAALVKSQHTGEIYASEIPKVTQDIQTLGMDEVRRYLAEKEKNVEIKATEDMLRQNPDKDLAAYYQSVLEKHRGGVQKQAMEKAAVEILTPKDATNYYTEFNINQNAKDLAARNILFETLSNNTENATFWEKVLTFGRAVIPFANSRAVAKSVSEALGRDTKWADIGNPNEILQEFRNTIATASPERKKEIVQALVHGLERYSSFFGDKNAAQIALNLSQVLSSNKEDTITDTVFDTLGLPLVTSAKLLVNSARLAADLGKPARIAIKAGNPEAGAAMMAKDAIDGTKMSGLSLEEIAKQASSMNITPMEMSLDSMKVTQTLQESLSSFAQRLRGSIDNTLMPSTYSAEELAKGQNILDNIYSAARNKAVYEYTPETYNNGLFTGTVKWQSAEGKPFMTREAALAFGDETGKVGKAEQIGQPIEMTGLADDEIRQSFGQTREKQSWIFVENVKDPVPLDARGKFTLEDVEGRNFFNFGIPSLNSSIEVVNQRALGSAANAKIRRDLESAYKDSIVGVSAKDRVLITNALKEGDSLSNQAGSVGKVFDYSELTARGLSDKAIEGYYKQRILRDTMWLYRNREMVTELKGGGFKELAFNGNTGVGQMNTPVKPMELGTIKSQLTQGKVGKVLDTRTGEMKILDPDMLDELYASSGQVVRLYKPQGIGNRKYSHVIIDENSSTLREIVAPLPYRPGEFSRVYSDEYFVTMRYKLKDEFDAVSDITDTLRTAPSKEKAAQFVRAHNEALRVASSNLEEYWKVQRIEQLIGHQTNPVKFLNDVETGKIPKDATFDFHYNRETHSYLQDTIDEGIVQGRLFYSNKGEKLLSTDPARENTLNLVDSLGVELANISRFITSKDIRIDAIEKWMNSFGDGVLNPTFNKYVDFSAGKLDADKMKKALIESGSDLSKVNADELLKFAESTRKYIMNNLGIRTPEQKLAEARHRNLVEWLEKGLSKISTKASEWFGPTMRSMNVPDFLRSVNFHTSLGMGNAAQLVVQANGMMLAVARHPIHGLAAAKTAIPLRMALMSDNPDVWKTLATVDSLSSLGLKNINEFTDIVQAIKKSGILSDIKSTALYNVEDGALDMYKGMSRNALKEGSAFFFNRGEEFSRLVSWEVSRREWIKSNPDKLWNSEEGLKAISIRQKEYNLGMQSYNTAAWQHGWAGIPMQFLQYNIKLLAALTHSATQLGKGIEKQGWKAFTNFDNGSYRGFTPSEALILLGSQAVLYGAAGNGLKTIADEVLGSADSKMSEEQKMYVAEGLAGGLFYSLTKEMDGEGAKLALGSRLGSFNWYNQMFDKIFYDKTDVTDFLLGATKSNGVKVIDVAKDLARLWHVEDLTPELALNELGKIPQIISSWSNGLKAYTYLQNEGYVTSKDGTPIARLNTKENLAAFLGISTVQVQEYYTLLKDRNRFYEDLNELALSVQKLQLQQWQAIKDGDTKLADDLERYRWAIMPKDMAHRRYVEERLKTKIWPGDTASDKVRRDFVERMNQENDKFRVLDKELK